MATRRDLTSCLSKPWRFGKGKEIRENITSELKIPQSLKMMICGGASFKLVFVIGGFSEATGANSGRHDHQERSHIISSAEF